MHGGLLTSLLAAGSVGGESWARAQIASALALAARPRTICGMPSEALVVICNVGLASFRTDQRDLAACKTLASIADGEVTAKIATHGP